MAAGRRAGELSDHGVPRLALAARAAAAGTPPARRLWTITAVAYLAINLLPARLGEVVRPWLLSRRSSVSFSNVVGNLVVEKTMDSVVILFYILAGLIMVDNLPAWVRTGALFPPPGP
jgi:hypothetical protein